MRVAIVGAGLAGLAAARELAGHEVVVLEKSRGVGGRTATRRGPNGLHFDHGAPFLHDGGEPLARGAHLTATAEHTLRLPGGRTRTETVGAGANNAPAKALAAGLKVRAGVRVGVIAPDGPGWRLAADDGLPLGCFDAVIVTAPAPQAAALLAAAPALAGPAAGVSYDPCWAVMAAWTEPLGLPFTATDALDGLRWAVAEASKPGRAPGERWVLQADAALSAALLEASPEEIAPLLLERFAPRAPAPLHLAAHRWRFARPRTPLPVPYLRTGTLLAAGDWCGGRDAGAALRSGRAAGSALFS